MRLQKRPAQPVSIFYFLFSIFFLTTGCGAPGEPQPPSPAVPQAIADHTRRRRRVLLTHHADKGTLGERLQQVPTFEVLRGTLRVDGTRTPSR